MFGLSVVDILVIGLYFAAILGIGFRAMRHIRSQEDYFLGGRRFGKLVQIFSAFGQGTSADSAVGTTTTTYNNGASGIWSALLFLWGTPIYWFTSPWYRRLRVLTLGDFFEERYGSKRMAGFYAVVASLWLMLFIAIGMKAVSATVLGIAVKSPAELSVEEKTEYDQAVAWESLITRKVQGVLTSEQKHRLEELERIRPRKEFSHLTETKLILTICLIVFVYAIAGGLEAAVYTDILQGMFIIVLSVILIPFGLARINAVYGGESPMDAIRTMHHRLPQWYFDIFGSSQTLDFTWYYIASISVLIAVTVAVQANQMNAIGSAKDELTARIGFTAGCFMKRFCTVLWGLTGLIAVTLYAGQIRDSDLVWGYATRDLLRGPGLGLVGLMIACLLAALMSSADMMMITASGVLTRNLYRPLLPYFEERHYVRVGRILGGVVLIGAAVFACWFSTVLQLLKMIWEFNAILAAAFWCGMKWRRTTRIGAWSSMLVTSLLFVLIPALGPWLFPSLRTSTTLLKQTDPAPITRTYQAQQMDVEQRQKEIEQWDEKHKQGSTLGSRPQQILLGQTMDKIIQPPRKSIFWSKGIEIRDGQPQGQGWLYIELVLVDQCKDLSTLPYAMVETIRTLIRLLLPFAIIIVVSLLTRPENKESLDRFYVKMRTPVRVDKELDREEMARSLAYPIRFQERLLFPHSQFEFFKWDRIDIYGFALSALTVLGIIGMLYSLLHLGT
ncbi:MAG: sodium:solute symporter family protein [Sedimentisphaerales bacterium]|nr:sodium:solute symporter family protein [Sedimentisphaerales bacterium]